MKTLLAILGLTAILGAADGAALYNKCASCHGVQGEKHALNKSKIIADLSKDEIVTAIKGYKDGSYGGPLKAMMKSQVAALDDAQIDAVATYIDGLK